MKLSILLLFFSSTLILARIGENENYCNGRYGTPLTNESTTTTNKKKPLLPVGYTKTYDYQGWTIRVGYIEFNGPAIIMNFRKKAGGAIQDDEIAAILSANTPNGMKWQRGVYTRSPLEGSAGVFGNIGSNVMGAGAWKRSDGVIATLEPLGMALIIETPIAIEIARRAKEEKETKRKAAIPAF